MHLKAWKSLLTTHHHPFPIQPPDAPASLQRPTPQIPPPRPSVNPNADPTFGDALRQLAAAYDAGQLHEAALFYHGPTGYNCLISPITTDPHGFTGYISSAVTFYDTQRYMNQFDSDDSDDSEEINEELDPLTSFINSLPEIPPPSASEPVDRGPDPDSPPDEEPPA